MIESLNSWGQKAGRLALVAAAMTAASGQAPHSAADCDDKFCKIDSGVLKSGQGLSEASLGGLGLLAKGSSTVKLVFPFVGGDGKQVTFPFVGGADPVEGHETKVVFPFVGGKGDVEVSFPFVVPNPAERKGLDNVNQIRTPAATAGPAVEHQTK